MTRQLRMTLEGLEERIVERTQELERRALQLRLAAEVGSVVASVRVLDELLPQVARLISERFGYYHVGIFLLDPSGEYAVLRAANSEGGQRMLARNHRLKVGEVGIVGYAVARREARIALDVAQDQVHYKNPDLPETRSELALPLMVGGQVLGALDVQSTQPLAFSTDVIATLQILADQVAIAIENARLFTENQAALEAARRAYGQISREAWDRLLRARTEFGYMANRQDALFPSTQSWTPEMEEANRTGEVVQGGDGSVAIPIKDRDVVLGVIRLRKPEELPWSPEEVELADTLSRQLFLALEAARLYQETQARAERERLAGEITTRMRSSNDPQTILQTAVRELRSALKVQRAQILVQPIQVDLDDAEPEEGGQQ
jgi:GAF domain-containing protein